MKKRLKRFLIILGILLVLIAITFLGINCYAQKRYKEMHASMEEGILWQFRATRPNGCLVEEDGIESEFRAPYLINQGYIKKEDLLDIDNKSYCKAYAITKCENQKFTYKIYLKCKYYKDKGYHDYWE